MVNKNIKVVTAEQAKALHQELELAVRTFDVGLSGYSIANRWNDHTDSLAYNLNSLYRRIRMTHQRKSQKTAFRRDTLTGKPRPRKQNWESSSENDQQKEYSKKLPCSLIGPKPSKEKFFHQGPYSCGFLYHLRPENLKRNASGQEQFVWDTNVSSNNRYWNRPSHNHNYKSMLLVDLQKKLRSNAQSWWGKSSTNNEILACFNEDSLAGVAIVGDPNILYNIQSALIVKLETFHATDTMEHLWLPTFLLKGNREFGFGKDLSFIDDKVLFENLLYDKQNMWQKICNHDRKLTTRKMTKLDFAIVRLYFSMIKKAIEYNNTSFLASQIDVMPLAYKLHQKIIESQYDKMFFTAYRSRDLELRFCRKYSYTNIDEYNKAHKLDSEQQTPFKKNHTEYVDDLYKRFNVLTQTKTSPMQHSEKNLNFSWYHQIAYNTSRIICLTTMLIFIGAFIFYTPMLNLLFTIFFPGLPNYLGFIGSYLSTIMPQMLVASSISSCAGFQYMRSTQLMIHGRAVDVATILFSDCRTASENNISRELELT